MSISAFASVYSGGGDGTKPILAVKICPSACGAAAPRRHFHLALLLDVSGSMHGERIDALRRTLHLLVDALCDNDVLTLITYNSTANRPADCVILSSETRETLHRTIDSLVAEGGTNMEEAISLLMTTATPVDAVFILTDGLINRGMSSSAGLIRLLQNQMNKGVPINTLGYGADHNSRLLRDMALRSNGSYTYADAAEVLPSIIGDIMGGLEAEVGRQGKLMIPAGCGWKCLEIGTGAGAAEAGVNVGTLIADKCQWVVLEGDADATAPTITFTWMNGANEAQMFEIEVNPHAIPALEILEQRERCRVASVFANVMDDIENYKFDIARSKLNDLTRQLNESPAKDTLFVIRLQAQVDDMLDSLKSVSHPAPVGGGGGGRLVRSPSFPGLATAPSVAPMISRLASNTTVLGNQRGIMSAWGAPNSSPVLFSSPTQQTASHRLVSAYSQTTQTTQTPPTAGADETA